MYAQPTIEDGRNTNRSNHRYAVLPASSVSRPIAPSKHSSVEADLPNAPRMGLILTRLKSMSWTYFGLSGVPRVWRCWAVGEVRTLGLQIAHFTFELNAGHALQVSTRPKRAVALSIADGGNHERSKKVEPLA